MGTICKKFSFGCVVLCCNAIYNRENWILIYDDFTISNAQE